MSWYETTTSSFISRQSPTTTTRFATRLRSLLRT
jgi:hypothetical protein